jgi:hypothetical protein
MPMRRVSGVAVLVSLVAAMSVVAAGARTSEAVSSVSRFVLDEHGWVGALRLDSARIGAVRRIFGRGELLADPTALAYDCRRPGDCLTFFYFNDGRLSDVDVSRDRRFRTRRGTRVGMTLREAQRRERHTYRADICPGGIERSSRQATLIISVDTEANSGRGRVDGLILSSRTIPCSPASRRGIRPGGS